MPRVEGGGTKQSSSPRNRLRRWVSLGVKINVGPVSKFTKLERNQGQYQVSSQDWCCFSDRNQILQKYLNESLSPVENWKVGRAKDTYRGASREIDGAAAKVCSLYYFFFSLHCCVSVKIETLSKPLQKSTLDKSSRQYKLPAYHTWNCGIQTHGHCCVSVQKYSDKYLFINCISSMPLMTPHLLNDFFL